MPSAPAISHILYVSYDGLTDPLGRSQVLPYLRGLAQRGHRITLLTCEKPDRLAREGAAVAALCAEAGIAWWPLRYHKRPPVLSSMLDLALLRRAARRIHRADPVTLTHCRSYIPAAVGLDLKLRFGVPLLFDMRGFWPDEKVEGGNWPQSNPPFRAVYRHFKRLESHLLRASDQIVSLTHAGKAQLLSRPELGGDETRISVIPCCVDFDHFRLIDADARNAARETLDIAPDARVVAYLGSLGGWYMLGEMLDFFRAFRLRFRGARMLFVTLDDAAPIRAETARRGVDPDALVITPAGRDDVPRLMAAADLGLFFIAPVFSKTASSPTKMGEMLSLGLPIVTNAGVGDVARIVEDTGGGVAIQRFDEAAYQEAIDAIEGLKSKPDERRQSALPWFDLELGIARYDEAYRALGANPASSNAASKRPANSSSE